MAMILRREDASDHRAVELLTRDAFWGMSGPRCDEHLLVHRLREADAFVPELDIVAVDDGVVVGHVVYSRARIVGRDRSWDVLTFGPLTVQPGLQHGGVGSALMRFTLAEATRLGHRVVVVYGHPDYYPRFGFRPGAEVGITAPGGATFDALMVLALVDGGLDGVSGEFHEDPVFHLDPADVDAFDSTFPDREPATLTPVDALVGHVPPGVVQALRARGIGDLETLRRHSSAEVAAVDGVGDVGSEAIRTYLRACDIRWGAPA
ncbi:MAG: GNAT family N-acetyltransferase [Cellulomonadaceae bacterium]|nr:GNAT family N-acetyltransferase [Cellulomonadaceae bacterium]